MLHNTSFRITIVLLHFWTNTYKNASPEKLQLRLFAVFGTEKYDSSQVTSYSALLWSTSRCNAE